MVQASGVEIEVNGSMTYDRGMIKLDAARLKKLHQRVIDAGAIK